MFFTFSLVVFWVLACICFAGAIYSGEAEPILLMLVFGFPLLAFITFVTVCGGWVMPVIVCWLSLFVTVGMITG